MHIEYGFNEQRFSELAEKRLVAEIQTQLAKKGVRTIWTQWDKLPALRIVPSNDSQLNKVAKFLLRSQDGSLLICPAHLKMMGALGTYDPLGKNIFLDAETVITARPSVTLIHEIRHSINQNYASKGRDNLLRSISSGPIVFRPRYGTSLNYHRYYSLDEAWAYGMNATVEINHLIHTQSNEESNFNIRRLRSKLFFTKVYLAWISNHLELIKSRYFNFFEPQELIIDEVLDSGLPLLNARLKNGKYLLAEPDMKGQSIWIAVKSDLNNDRQTYTFQMIVPDPSGKKWHDIQRHYGDAKKTESILKELIIHRLNKLDTLNQLLRKPYSRFLYLMKSVAYEDDLSKSELNDLLEVVTDIDRIMTRAVAGKL